MNPKSTIAAVILLVISLAIGIYAIRLMVGTNAVLVCSNPYELPMTGLLVSSLIKVALCLIVLVSLCALAIVYIIARCLLSFSG